MYAIVRVAGFQYLVREGDVVDVQKLEAEPGTSLKFDDVLFVRTDDKTVIGRPRVPKAYVEATVTNHLRTAKVRTFKFIRRENYHRKSGHRQSLSRIKIGKIHL
jgi:large subunit ribosomal protein L21